ncbi:MAG TPA: hypothetical protein VN958_02890 [Chitinophagaceae bacterium]|nr:hypothetical protein [Chitinophagaceae bacterium]
MIALDYNAILYGQYENVQKSKRKIIFLDFLSPVTIGNNQLKRINNKLSVSLMVTKGVHTAFQQNFEELKSMDLSNIKTTFNLLIQSYIELKSEIEELITKDKEKKYKELYITESLVSETIEILYDSLRLLKKASKKPNIPTTEEAKLAAKISTYSLEKILHGS